MSELRLADLEGKKPDDTINLNVTHPEEVDFGIGSNASTSQTIVILNFFFLIPGSGGSS